jgi:hypothetical protein
VRATPPKCAAGACLSWRRLLNFTIAASANGERIKIEGGDVTNVSA